MIDGIQDKFNNIYFVLFCFLIINVFGWLFTVGFFLEKIEALEILHDKEYCLECETIVDKK